MAIFIPEKMRVGFVNRNGTFDGKLSYIIYYDNKGKLRKEASWEGWRDKSIEPIDFQNEPTEGFCLNKKVGGYDTGWNHRNTYCRIYDPRGYEFEIKIENLLYILENTNSIKGKGLEGKFVYGMDGKDLILIPCDSPDYKLLKEFNEKVKNGTTFKMKDMIIGGRYLSNSNEELIYMGRYIWYKYGNINHGTKKYIFKRQKSDGFIEYSSVGKIIIECISDICCSNYAELFDKLENYENYNPYDSTKNEYINHTLESFTNYINNTLKINKTKEFYPCNYCSIRYFVNHGDEAISHDTYYRKNNNPYSTYEEGKGIKYCTFVEGRRSLYSQYNRMELEEEEYVTIEEFFNRVNPQYKKEYLLDGRLRKVYYYE